MVVAVVGKQPVCCAMLAYMSMVDIAVRKEHQAASVSTLSLAFPLSRPAHFLPAPAERATGSHIPHPLVRIRRG